MAKAVKLADIAERLGVIRSRSQKYPSGQRCQLEALCGKKIKQLADELDTSTICRKKEKSVKSYNIGVLGIRKISVRVCILFTGECIRALQRERCRKSALRCLKWYR